MTLWQSGPAPTLGGWIMAGIVGWLWSVPVGLGLWGLAALLGKVSAEAALVPMGAALFLIFAPAFSWVGLVIALPMALGAARRGLFGPASAALIGALAGALAAWVIGGTNAALTAPFGAITLLIVQGIMARTRR